MKNYLRTQITLYEEDKKEEASMRCSLLHSSWDQILQRCPSVCPSVCLSVPHPVSAMYHLQFWLDPFHIYTSYQATSEGVSCVKFLAKYKKLKFWQFFKICNFDIVLFWLGICCESLVWVIMGRQGVSQNEGILVVLILTTLTDKGYNYFFVWKMIIFWVFLQVGELNILSKVSLF